MPKIPQIPDIPEGECMLFVAQLLEVNRYQVEIIQGLRDEIAVLKGNKPKPKIKPNNMEKRKEYKNLKENDWSARIEIEEFI